MEEDQDSRASSAEVARGAWLRPSRRAACHTHKHTHTMFLLLLILQKCKNYFVLTCSAGMYALMSKATMSGWRDSTNVRHAARSSSLYCLMRIHTCRESRFIKHTQPAHFFRPRKYKQTGEGERKKNYAYFGYSVKIVFESQRLHIQMFSDINWPVNLHCHRQNRLHQYNMASLHTQPTQYIIYLFIYLYYDEGKVPTRFILVISRVPKETWRWTWRFQCFLLHLKFFFAFSQKTFASSRW